MGYFLPVEIDIVGRLGQPSLVPCGTALYGGELAKDYITMVYALEGWERLFEKHAINYAVLDKEKPIYNAIGNGNSFAMVYEDETSAIFVKRRH